MKIPHPWWHWIFTKWVLTRERGLFEVYHEYVCSKCKRVYVIEDDQGTYPRVTVKND